MVQLRCDPPRYLPWSDGRLVGLSWLQSHAHSRASDLEVRCPPPHEECPNSFDLDIDKEARELWEETLKAHAPVLTCAPASTVEVAAIVDQVYDALQTAAKTALKKKGPNPARASMW